MQTNTGYGWTLQNFLTHWGRVRQICISKLTTIVSDNGLPPGQHQAIIWTYDRILLIGPLRTNFSEILIEMHIFSFKEMHFKMLSVKWRPFCLGLNVLTNWFVQRRHSVSIGMEMSSCLCNFHHWLHRKLSKWQLPVQLMINCSTYQEARKW